MLVARVGRGSQPLAKEAGEAQRDKVDKILGDTVMSLSLFIFSQTANLPLKESCKK